jgi:predicted SPOUT superfamily RNA methylase MTH1
MNANTKRRQWKIRKEVIQRHREGIPMEPGKRGKLISCGSTKNVVQVVLHNTLPDGKRESITRFVKDDEDKQQYRREFGPKREYNRGSE